MNILFTTSAAPAKSPFFTDEKRPPLGLGFLISLARKSGHRVFFIDNYLRPSNFIEDGYLQRHDIDIVGIYANTICFRDTLRMLQALQTLREKKRWQGSIIVGGPHTSVSADTVPEFVDYLVQGEGEQAFAHILEGEADGRMLKEERIKYLDALPFSPWDIFAELPYDFSCPWMDISPVFTMNTSRGCPYQCTFCSVGGIWGKEYTCMSAARIIAEIEYLITEYGARGIYFREDNFTFDIRRLHNFCERVITEHFGIQWACESRVEPLCDEAAVRVMKRAGCQAVYLGIESGSQRILDMVHKGITVEQIERAVTLCKRYGIRTYCSLIAGIPGETYNDYLKSKKLMHRLQPDTFSFNVFVGLPGSRVYDDMLRHREYEFIDDVGLAYAPGFMIKAEFFYRRKNEFFADYIPSENTDYDKRLRCDLSLRSLRERVSPFVPMKIKDYVKGITACQKFR